MTNNTVIQIIEKIKNVPLKDVRIVREYQYPEIVSYPDASLVTYCYVVWLSETGDTIEAKLTLNETSVIAVKLKKTNPNAGLPTHMTIDKALFMSAVGAEYLNALLVHSNSTEIKDEYKSFI